jgi:hypothetical protein
MFLSGRRQNRHTDTYMRDSALPKDGSYWCVVLHLEQVVKARGWCGRVGDGALKDG